MKYLFFLAICGFLTSEARAQPNIARIGVANAKSHVGEYATVFGRISDKEFKRNEAKPDSGMLVIQISDTASNNAKFLLLVRVKLGTSDTVLWKTPIAQEKDSQSQKRPAKNNLFSISGRIFLFHKQPAIMINAQDFPVGEQRFD